MAIGRSFGQHEPLTTRLHNLVRSYPKGLGVLKEFIQNADDAEADTVTFIIDERQHDTGGLPDEMKWLHTMPALLIHNNSPFSERDIEGIQRIGESGKSDSVGKTGRFGLGFNACYNVTDVPCFFTRGALHFFDPHFQTVPGASMESPGRCFGADELVGEGWPLLAPLRPFVNGERTPDGTVFRLPFRGEEQGFSSRIKGEHYTVADALDAVRELRDMSSAMLLFLKHVRRLKVEIWRPDGSVGHLLHMEAVNPEEIAVARREVNALLAKSDADVILNELAHCGSVYSTCRHTYSVSIDGTQHTEEWRVTDGFFVDEHDEVLTSCRRMIDNEEKAIPYAGAAWPLDGRAYAGGRMFCSLPIPMHTRLPVLLNGYFDLDDSRQNMFLDPSAQGSAKLRVDWNRALLRTSVAGAYCQLLDDLRSDLGGDAVDAYYRAFPPRSGDDSSWEGWLTGSLYELAATVPLLRVCSDPQWCNLSGTRSLPMSLQPVAEALVSERCLPIPTPALPAHVRDGFMSTGSTVPELTPEDLRNELRESEDCDCALASAPRPCLRERDWVICLLRFCLSDSPDDDIKGLPLAIDCRGHLRTVGLTEYPLHLGTEDDLEVFIDHPEWFVERRFADQVDLEASEDADLLEMDGRRFVATLREYVAAQTAEDETARMNRGRAGPLTDAWLCAVFRRLLACEHDIGSELNEMPLVPDQTGVLHSPGDSATPLLLNGQRDLKRALIDLSVPLVTNVSMELSGLIAQFAKKVECIWWVTPRDLIDTLASECSDVLAEYEEVTDTHRALLTYFGRGDNLKALGQLTDRQDSLKALRLFPTPKGALVHLGQTAYVPQEFASPRVDFDVVLLDDGPQHRWRELYVMLGVAELSRARLTREVLLPSFPELERPAQIEALSWLRDNLSAAQSEDEDGGSGRLFAEVHEAAIIVCEDGQLRSPAAVYQPNSKLASAVLGDDAVFPDMDRTYSANSERWLEFFRQLNMPVEPRLRDVVSFVRRLIVAEPSPETSARLQAVYEFIKVQVDTEIRDQTEISDDLSRALMDLADTAWIPLRREAGDLLCFVQPDEPYACPGEVHFARVGQLLASQSPITTLRPEPARRSREAMGFPSGPSAPVVVRHFQAILAACSTENGMPKESVLVRALGQIYRFFGGEVPAQADEPSEHLEAQDGETVEALAETFSDVPCLWDQDRKRFWKPCHVFSDDVRYMEPWRRTLKNGEAVIERGYTALGRRESPTINDWKMVLQEIGTSETSSPTEHEDVIRQIVRRVVETLRSDGAADSSVLVLTRDGRMLPARDVFLADAPWYESVVDSGGLPLLARSLESIGGIRRVLGIPSLAKSIEQRLVACPEDSDSEDGCTECSRLQALLRSPEFCQGLRRLLRHEGHELFEEPLHSLRGVQVRCVRRIHTCLYLNSGGEEQFLGDAEADTHWDEEVPEAMLPEGRIRYFRDDLAGLLNRTLGDAALQNLAPLVHALRCAPSEVSMVLDDLKICQYASADGVSEDDRAEEMPQDFPAEVATGDADREEETQDGPTDTGSGAGQGGGEDQGEATHPSDQDAESTTPGRGDGRGQQDDPLPSGRSDGSQGPTQPGSTGDHAEEKQSLGDESESPGSGNAEADRKPSTASRPRPSGSPTRPPSPDHRTGKVPVGRRKARGSTASRPSVPAPQRRLLSYVTTKSSKSDQDTDQRKNRRIQIGKAAVQIVIDHEARKGWQARSMSHTNAGYDVISEGGGEARHIEVKGTEGAWGERGVALTPTQFFYERENPERDFWLYVVEDVFSKTPKVHEIHTPCSKVDRFVLDGGWRQSAESTDADGVTLPVPVPGDEVIENGVSVGSVERVVDAGRFPLVIYRDVHGTLQRKRLADLEFRAKES